MMTLPVKITLIRIICVKLPPVYAPILQSDDKMQTA